MSYCESLMNCKEITHIMVRCDIFDCYNIESNQIRTILNLENHINFHFPPIKFIVIRNRSYY